MNLLIKLKIKKRYLPAIFYYCLIWYMSSRTISINIHGMDKTIHIIEYAVLGFLIAFAFNIKPKNFRTYSKYSLAIGFIAGVTDEIHQYFVPTRSLDIFDITADVTGITFGIFIFFAINYAIQKYNSGIASSDNF